VTSIVEVRDRVRDFAARQPIAAALAASLVVHACLYTTWLVGKEYGWWKQQPTWHLFSAIFKPRPKPIQKARAAEQQAMQPQERVIPLQFVDVDPTALEEKPPPETKYYGERSARAANPDDSVESNVPKVDGKEERLVRLEDSQKPKAFPLQPSEPPEKAEQAKPKNDLLGDLAKLNPDRLRPPSDGRADTTYGDAAASKPERPRRLSEVREQPSPRAGEKMRQDGGVKRRGRASFDVAGSTFGAYDAMLIRAIEQKWFQLLDETPLSYRSGKVVLQFVLTYRGEIKEMNVAENSTSDSQAFLCKLAVEAPAPFGEWPSDMRRAMGARRALQFTFYFD